MITVLGMQRADRMLLGNRHVEVALRETTRELHQTRALAHRGRDADDARVTLRHVAQPLAEDLRVGRASALFLEYGATHRIEWTRSMPLDRVGLGGRVALALARHDVQELWSTQLADVA
jgi:hypothetical protein